MRRMPRIVLVAMSLSLASVAAQAQEEANPFIAVNGVSVPGTDLFFARRDDHAAAVNGLGQAAFVYGFAEENGGGVRNALWMIDGGQLRLVACPSGYGIEPLMDFDERIEIGTGGFVVLTDAGEALVRTVSGSNYGLWAIRPDLAEGTAQARAVAEMGQPAPDGSTWRSVCRRPGTGAVIAPKGDASGSLLFVAGTEDVTSLWLDRDGTQTPIFSFNRPVGGIDGAVGDYLFDFFFDPQGVPHVAIRVEIDDGAGNLTTREGIWAWSGSALTPVWTTEPMAAGAISEMNSLKISPDGSRVAFEGKRWEENAIGSLVSKDVVYTMTVSGADPIAIAEPDMIVPSIGDLRSATPIGLSNGGRVLMVAAVEDVSFGETAETILEYHQGSLSSLAAVGEEAPGGGLFTDIQSTRITAGAGVALVGKVNEGQGSNQILFRREAPGAELKRAFGPSHSFTDDLGAERRVDNIWDLIVADAPAGSPDAGPLACFTIGFESPDLGRGVVCTAEATGLAAGALELSVSAEVAEATTEERARSQTRNPDYHIVGQLTSLADRVPSFEVRASFSQPVKLVAVRLPDQGGDDSQCSWQPDADGLTREVRCYRNDSLTAPLEPGVPEAMGIDVALAPSSYTDQALTVTFSGDGTAESTEQLEATPVSEKLGAAVADLQLEGEGNFPESYTVTNKGPDDLTRSFQLRFRVTDGLWGLKAIPGRSCELSEYVEGYAEWQWPTVLTCTFDEDLAVGQSLQVAAPETQNNDSTSMPSNGEFEILVAAVDSQPRDPDEANNLLVKKIARDELSESICSASGGSAGAQSLPALLLLLSLLCARLFRSRRQ